MPSPVPKRRSIRLPAEFYLEGDFLVTIVTAGREPRFGVVVDDEAVLSPLGTIVDQEWRRTSHLRREVELYEHVVMPNHFHGVLRINEPSNDRFEDDRRKPRSLASAVAGFKAAVTSSAARKGHLLPIWQRGFHEKVLYTEEAIEAACEYVAANPANWETDPYRRQ